MNDDWEDISGGDALEYFFHDVVGTNTLDDDMRPSRIVPWNIFYLALTWTIVGSCLSFGIEWTGRIAYVTMGLPIFMLFVLLIRSLTLPGAANGVKEYVGTWDFSVLVEQPDVWSTAVSQIFFSIGVAVRSRLDRHFGGSNYKSFSSDMSSSVWNHDCFWITLRKKCASI